MRNRKRRGGIEVGRRRVRGGTGGGRKTKEKIRRRRMNRRKNMTMIIRRGRVYNGTHYHLLAHF